jgi:hypothetical protein
MSDKNIETITHGLEPIALIIRADYDEPGIQFFTPGSFSQQVAYMKHPKGHKITAHVHPSRDQASGNQDGRVANQQPCRTNDPLWGPNLPHSR